MKNPLTSKERRGLVAVAAAALLCIGAGFIFRSCGSRSGVPGPVKVVVIDNDSVTSELRGDSISRSSKKKSRSESSNGKRSRRAKRQRAEKTYPSRSPLDEPCD